MRVRATSLLAAVDSVVLGPGYWLVVGLLLMFFTG